MPIKHEHADTGAECDQFREAISQYDSCVTKDQIDDEGTTTIIYTTGEGDPPFVKYRLTLEAIGLVSQEEYIAMNEKAAAEEDKSDAA